MQPFVDGYLLPIRYALITFPVLAFVLTLPVLIVQYRKYGYMNKVRLVALYALMLYLLVSFYLVILPLPPSDAGCAAGWRTSVSLRPLQFVRDIARETQAEAAHPLTYFRLLKERAFLQAAFNLALFVPLGLFLRYYFRRRIGVAALLSFALSLFFETTQGTGLYGIYGCPYRLFDVDDLLLNTAGGLVGYVAAPLLMRALPDISRLDEKVDLAAKRVGIVRRWVALQLDAFLLYPPALAALHDGKPLVPLAGLFLYFIVLPWLWNGRTVGKWIVRIRLTGRGGRIRFRELLHRCWLTHIALAALNLLALTNGLTAAAPMPTAVRGLLVLAALAADIAFAAAAIPGVFRGDRLLFYERWSGTRHRIAMPRGTSGRRRAEGTANGAEKRNNGE